MTCSDTPRNTQAEGKAATRRDRLNQPEGSNTVKCALGLGCLLDDLSKGFQYTSLPAEPSSPATAAAIGLLLLPPAFSFKPEEAAGPTADPRLERPTVTAKHTSSGQTRRRAPVAGGLTGRSSRAGG